MTVMKELCTAVLFGLAALAAAAAVVSQVGGLLWLALAVVLFVAGFGEGERR